MRQCMTKNPTACCTCSIAATVTMESLLNSESFQCFFALGLDNKHTRYTTQKSHTFERIEFSSFFPNFSLNEDDVWMHSYVIIGEDISSNLQQRNEEWMNKWSSGWQNEITFYFRFVHAPLHIDQIKNYKNRINGQLTNFTFSVNVIRELCFWIIMQSSS